MAYEMDADQSNVVECGQNAIFVSDFTAVEGSVGKEDVPGSSLNGRMLKELKVPELKVPELKYWLTCRGVPTKWKESRSGSMVH